MSEQTEPTSDQTRRAVWDFLGITASGLCLLHCILLPVAAVAIPLAGLSFLDHSMLHRVFAGVIIVVSALAFIPGFRTHRRRRVKLHQTTLEGKRCPHGIRWPIERREKPIASIDLFTTAPLPQTVAKKSVMRAHRGRRLSIAQPALEFRRTHDVRQQDDL